MNDEINWTISSFNELSTKQLYDILHLRNEIFIVEQNDIYLDVDYKDLTAYHLMGCLEEDLVAYCRMFISSERGSAKVGRVLVDNKFRNHGLGRLLMTEALNAIEQRVENATILISAQCYLQKFYESFGFVVQGESYMDGSIEHIDMIKSNKM